MHLSNKWIVILCVPYMKTVRNIYIYTAMVIVYAAMVTIYPINKSVPYIKTVI